MKEKPIGNCTKLKNYLITHTKQFIRRYLIDPSTIRERSRINSQILMRIKEQESLSIAFVVVNESMWKYEMLFRRIEKENHLQTKILVSPSTQIDKEKAQNEAYRCFLHFFNQGYPVYLCSEESVSLIEDIDLIFYCTPYDSLLLPYLRLQNQKKALGFYSLYGYPLEEYKVWYDLTFHNLLYRYYLSYSQELEVYKRLSRTKGANGLVSGAPIYDHLMQHQDRDQEESDLPLFIIAPHHSIEPWGYALSTFLSYSSVFLGLIEKYHSRARFVFKPHPMLKNKLYHHPQWGVEKTDAYYNYWKTIPNCNICQDDYIHLFHQATALIHDCSAFTVEFQMLAKPALFLRRKGVLPSKLNNPARVAFGLHDMADSPEDLFTFVEKIIQPNFQDKKRQERISFVKEYVQSPKEGQWASDIILEDIKNLLL